MDLTEHIHWSRQGDEAATVTIVALRLRRRGKKERREFAPRTNCHSLLALSFLSPSDYPACSLAPQGSILCALVCSLVCTADAILPPASPPPPLPWRETRIRVEHRQNTSVAGWDTKKTTTSSTKLISRFQHVSLHRHVCVQKNALT